VNRIIMVSAAVLFPARGLTFAIFRRLLKHIAHDLSGAGSSTSEQCARLDGRKTPAAHEWQP